MKLLGYSVSVILILECIIKCQGVAVMSIDFGTEWMKVAIVSPGVPMEIALNKESKRKTPVAIAFRDGERTFGEDALTVGVRFPKQCYIYLLDLLGKKVDNPVVKLFQQRFPYYEIVPDPVRGTVVFQHDPETQFNVEELVAMMLKKAQEMAINAAGNAVNEAVITVPGYFNQAERKAMLQAAELAGIKVLQLINDYTAVALNYGIFRRKDFNESAQYIMLYDMGASSTTATIVSYQVVKLKEKGYVESHPQLSILGVGYDRTLGGLEMQLRLRDYLGKKFNEQKKTPNDVFKNPRALAKLFKEAGRLKTVLSANVDHYAQVEGLLDEKDFKLQVTREELEKLSSDLFERVKNPVLTALKASSLSMDIISQVILVGAGTRVPMVQEKLLAVVGSELGKNLNTDESAVLGAVYKAADLSAGFKVKKFITKDGVLFPIQVTFERETDSGTKLVKRTLFGSMNPYPQKKILTFNKYLTDFEFSVGYAELDLLEPSEIENIGPLNLTKVSLSGVADAIAKHQGPSNEIKGVKAHFFMDESGILKLSNVELVVEKIVPDGEGAAEESPLSKLGNTISKLFTSEEAPKEEPATEPPKEALDDKPEDKEEAKEGEKKDEKPSESNKTSDSGEKDDTKKQTKEGEKEDKKPKPVVLKENINSKEVPLFVPQLRGEQLEQSQSKLAKLNANDEERHQRESTLNALESFVFETQNRLKTDEYSSAVSHDEKQKISEAVSKIAEWLDEESMDSNAETLSEKLKGLRKLTENWFMRVGEHRERPEALKALKTMINGSTNFLMTIKNISLQQPDSPQASIFTAVELETLEKTIKDTHEWMEKAVIDQDKLKLWETPKLTIKVLSDKMASLDREVQYLVNKAKIWKPPPKPVEEKPVREEPSPSADAGKTETKNTEKVVPSPESDNITESGGSKNDSESMKIEEIKTKDENKTEDKDVPPAEPVAEEEKHTEL
ncbi:hypoxia up-regulated protein 1 isoform X2 [Halyomorpha halys]|nr:hypoxia up-regulated protein 1 [Halyomorpha halys]